MNSLKDRYLGALLGLACGDAVGTTVEFGSRGTFEPLTDMIGGGPFDLAPGQWTDDTSMALCLAASLLHCGGFDAVDQMNRYVNWWQWGYYSCTGECFDIGLTTAKALQRYLVTGDPMAGSDDPATAGNGSLMRLAPVVLFYYPEVEGCRHHARLSSATTHAAPEALDACDLFAVLLGNALSATHKNDVLRCSHSFGSPAVAALADGCYAEKDESEIRSSGYCVDSLEAALWCFTRGNSLEETVLMAANLGGDADTVAAIAGQLAGAFYGGASIPSRWLERLAMREEIERLAAELVAVAASRQVGGGWPRVRSTSLEATSMHLTKKSAGADVPR
jgi:ADP-ribosyl-[dinitrogen reductase] hydrolase